MWRVLHFVVSQKIRKQKKCLRSAVQLWTVANYHWYLKQSLEFGPDPQKVPVCVCWDPERPLRLHVVTRSWTSITYDWGWTTERSTGLDATDNASVAVIDGGKGQWKTRGCSVVDLFQYGVKIYQNPLRKNLGDDLPAVCGSSSHVFLRAPVKITG